MKFYLPVALASLSNTVMADAYLFPSPFSRSVILSRKNSPASIWREADRMIERMDKMFEDDQMLLANRADKMFDDNSWTLANRMVERMDKMLELPQASPFYKITNDDKTFQVTVDLPGVNASDIDISVDDEHNMLTMKGEGKKEDENMVSSFKFSQRFSLDPSIDRENITANLKDGVLTVSAPKKVPQLESSETKIPVTLMESTGEAKATAEAEVTKSEINVEQAGEVPEMKMETLGEPEDPFEEEIDVKKA